MGEIYDACHILATHLRAPKRWTVGVNKNIFFSSNPSIFLDLRYASLRCDNHQKFNFKKTNTPLKPVFSAIMMFSEMYF
jgi:hypothetical protein